MSFVSGGLCPCSLRPGWVHLEAINLGSPSCPGCFISAQLPVMFSSGLVLVLYAPANRLQKAWTLLLCALSGDESSMTLSRRFWHEQAEAAGEATVGVRGYRRPPRLRAGPFVKHQVTCSGCVMNSCPFMLLMASSASFLVAYSTMA